MRERLRAEHPDWYCPDCGHLWRVHQNGGTPSQAVGRDDPVACYAAIHEPHDLERGDPGEAMRAPPYRLCGCTRLVDDPELAREVVRGQSAQGR